jgi:4'-phosphopantetheinyl transferase
MEKCVSVDDFALPGKFGDAVRSGGATPLPPAIKGVRLWWTALDRPPDEVDQLAWMLSSDERLRAARFGTDALRRRWIAGRTTLRMVLGQVLDEAPADVAIVRGRRGRPELAGAPSPDFNVSHTRDIALIGVADAVPFGMRIGIDIEHRDRIVNADGLARKFMSVRERALLMAMDTDQRRRHFLRLWTCKEAMSKATGDALAAPFRNIDVASRDELTLADGPPPYTPADWTLHAVDMPDGFIVTVALWNPPSISAVPQAP